MGCRLSCARCQRCRRSTGGGRAASAAEVWPTGPGFEFNLAVPLQGRPRDHACQPARFYRWEVQRDRLELSRPIRAWGERAGHASRRLGPIVGIEVVQRNPADRPSRYRLTDETGRTADLSAEELRVACNMTVQGLPEITNQTRVRSGDLEMAFSGAQVRIAGRGFGHGVGMCQWCAKVFADRGEPWHRNILRVYPGARLERAD
ncbi:hypothetical protein J4558_17350 [Leptolyngbya sp. 15MV]|nr:hypothetical protein J4558_17350 [Leptolyngbya sp. 15MV]